MAFMLCFFVVFLSFQKSIAQSASTPQSEVTALNSLAQQWGIDNVKVWDSTEPCSGTSIDEGTEFEAPYNNPAIKCNCTYNNNSTCHITHLRVYALNTRGRLSEELAALTYLSVFRIDKNYFTGPLPAFISNLSALESLELGHNAFSGTIPKELGSLKELKMLSFGTNNFSGTLPPELGNLTKLEQIYMDSSGVGGEIPSTFANLTNMQRMFASDSPFSGKIPDFIGNWTNLTHLRLQGNLFEGPIPFSLSSLTSLNVLRISDLSNMSSSLDFIKNLKNLTELVLRNALIQGNIPSDIGEYQRLETLDMSFNNLTGQIPSTLFNMSFLTNLFLGNNSLSGNLPTQKNENLQYIDLSYNELSGSFPSWVNQINQTNLVANNFIFSSTNRSIFPGLDCLQKNFPCNKNAPLYNKFSINAGGPEIRTADGILFEAENSSLGPASFYITSTEQWAVSNVGLFSKRIDPTNMGPDLYQTSRISPGSLRYYGLGLENGPYSVSLLFAETVFDDRSLQTWKSIGRRVFDIYIQGELRLKDFDISKEAGGPRIVLQKNFNANVVENYLEIHLFWGGKGTCCIPEEGYYGPSISALSVVSGNIPSVGISPTTEPKKSKTGLIVGLTVAIGAVSFILLLAVFYRKMKGSNTEDEEELLGIGPKPTTFSFSELRTATENFNPRNKLGEGGFGPVYKGTLLDGRIVAVKQLSIASHQGKSQFAAEIATISAVQHRNLVKLYGCCIEGTKRLLVYEYLENKSLDQALFGTNDLHLDWPNRFSICLGTARALAYLHEESRPRIVHRDVKASNILLDAELCPKISDFGLAKLYDDKKTHISTRVAGTIGYLAPEYAMRGHLTEKADVFGFGVVALEILSGRPNSDNSLDPERIYLLEWAWTLHENGRSLELVDPTLTGFNASEATRIIGVGLLCTQASPMMRPPMSRVVAMLAGDIEVSPITSKPSYLTDWDFSDITNSFISQDTSNSFTSSDPVLSSVNHTLPDIVGAGR